VGPRAGLDGCGKSLPPGSRFPVPARSELLYRLTFLRRSDSSGKQQLSRRDWLLEILPAVSEIVDPSPGIAQLVTGH
jgi:hypothetical protein